MCNITDIPVAIFIAHYITALNLVWLAVTAPSSCAEGWKGKGKTTSSYESSVNIASYEPKQHDDPTLEIPPGRQGKAKLNISNYQGKPSTL